VRSTIPPFETESLALSAGRARGGRAFIQWG
jgi:hypothetical protein